MCLGHAMKENPSPLLGTYKAEPSLPSVIANDQKEGGYPDSTIFHFIYSGLPHRLRLFAMTGTVLISSYTKLPLMRVGYPEAQLLLFTLSRFDLFPLAGASAD